MIPGGPVGHIIFFLDRERIHVGTQRDNPGGRIFPFYDSYHPGVCHGYMGDAVFGQFPPDEGRCLEFLIAQFRMGMQVMPDVQGIGFVPGGQ